MASNVIPLPALPREQTGTRATRRLRSTGQLPAIVYGHKQEAVNVSVPAKPFNEALNKGAHVFELTVGSKKENALLKDVQYDYLGTNIIHIDFARVDLNEKVTVTVGIELKGDAPGEKEGGVLQQILNEVQVECVVTEIPSVIVFNVSGVKLDDTVHVKDLVLPKGVVALTDADGIVAICHAIKEEIAEPVAGEVVEPEVIKKEKVDGEEGAAEAK